MTENPYIVLGGTVPELFGREKDLQKIRRRLEKAAPDNVSVIGSKFIGKTVFLHALWQYFKNNKTNFTACIYWNLAHGDTPTTDDEFYIAFGRELSQIESHLNADYQGYFGDNTTFNELKDFFEMLHEEGLRILVIMDSLDTFLGDVDLSRNLWDRLRSLAEMSSLRFVTGSRKKLREIVGSPDARVSPFWNIFGDSPQTLAPFDIDDWQKMFAPLGQRGIAFQSGGDTEVINLTGGIPILATAFCRRLWNANSDNTTLAREGIVESTGKFVDDKRDVIEDLWSDCDDADKEIVTDLAKGRSLKVAEVSHKSLLSLKNRGFVTEKDRDLKLCRTIENFVKSYNPEVSELRRILGTEDDFKRRMIEILQLRLEQLQEVDEDLITSLRFAVTKLNQPSRCIGEIRGLVNRAFTVIWQSELPSGTIPIDWTAGWRSYDAEGNRPETNPPNGNIPTGGGQKCYLLGLMTDSRKAGITKVSRTTYFMIDYLQNVGDFGQHLENEIVPIEFAYIACFAAIEMCDQLTKDLSK